jgi:uncharacterized protein (DUF983 family)
VARATLLLSRALRLRCPACGAGGLFASWFSMRPVCLGCGLVLEREQGYFLGAVMFNLVAAELLFAGGLVAVLLVSWPNPPWDALWIGSMVGMVAAPLLLYPFSKTLWLAFDLLFRPVQAHEFERHRAADQARRDGQRR